MSENKTNVIYGDVANLIGGDGATLIGGFCTRMKGGDKATLVGGQSSNMTGGNASVIIGDDCSVAKGKLGSLIVLFSRDAYGKIIDYAAEIVDGEIIRENVYYHLVGGKFAEQHSNYAKPTYVKQMKNHVKLYRVRLEYAADWADWSDNISWFENECIVTDAEIDKRAKDWNVTVDELMWQVEEIVGVDGLEQKQYHVMDDYADDWSVETEWFDEGCLTTLDEIAERANGNLDLFYDLLSEIEEI